MTEDEARDVLKAILRVRLRNAANLEPSHSGAFMQARDDTLQEIYREVESVLKDKIESRDRRSSIFTDLA
jgi:hypothetical protein